MPAGGWKGLLVYDIAGSCGVVTVIQTGRHADLWGACSDRFQQFARFQLIPELREKGVARIGKIVLKGSHPMQSAALPLLQKNFPVGIVYYRPARAESMRKVFARIEGRTRIKPWEPPEGS